MGRVVSIDYGLKRIGLAISDENRIIARSLGLIENKKTIKETIEAIDLALKPYQIEKVIVGNPLHLSGKEGFLSDEVRFFVSQFKTFTKFDVILWDERLSSLQAEKSLKEAGLSRKKRSKIVDGLSAVIILQSYLGF